MEVESPTLKQWQGGQTCQECLNDDDGLAADYTFKDFFFFFAKKSELGVI